MEIKCVVTARDGEDTVNMLVSYTGATTYHTKRPTLLDSTVIELRCDQSSGQWVPVATWSTGHPVGQPNAKPRKLLIPMTDPNVLAAAAKAMTLLNTAPAIESVTRHPSVNDGKKTKKDKKKKGGKH